ncbi:hypothetical protein C6P45_004117 [Maudiozyma exigua]|uniref:Uncharacterized protein n=1 Tax=Maudiozyma exigua TaxID=34358 RepID=A0A9P6WEX9_MAUEX|nr:hypothetical protein C6P45_004117 [Kazachstania exigua]
MSGTAALYMNEPNTNFMANYDAYYMQNHDQPVILDRQIMFGTMDTIMNHSDTLRSNNVRFFIGLDLQASQMAQLYDSDLIKNLYGSPEDIVMVNFDSKFLEDYTVRDMESLGIQLAATENSQQLISYLWNNSQLLKMMATQFSKKHDDTTMFLHRYVTLYKRCNSFGVDHIEKFQSFNDLMTLFNDTNPRGKVFIFSESMNNENMLALLISTMLKKDTTMKVQQCYQFITSLMDIPIDSIRTEKIFLCSGLTNYIESVKKFNAINSRKKFGTIVYNNNCATSAYAQANISKRSMRYTDTTTMMIDSNNNNNNNNDSNGKRARSD